MSCGPLASPVMMMGDCNSCPTCCQTSKKKRSLEKVQIALAWAHRFDGAHQMWDLKSVVHTVKSQTGTALVNPAYDSAATYVLDAVVSVGSKIYKATGPVAVGQAPWVGGAPWALQAETNPHVFLALDAGNAPLQWFDRKRWATFAMVEGGVKDMQYRIDVMATFTDCAGREAVLWDCLTLTVEDCA